MTWESVDVNLLFVFNFFKVMLSKETPQDETQMPLTLSIENVSSLQGCRAALHRIEPIVMPPNIF